MKKIFFTINRIIVLSHPSTWSYSAGMFILGIAIAISNSNYLGFSRFLSDKFILGSILLFFWILIMFNIFTFNLNDYFDREIDSKNPKKIRFEEIASEKDKWPVILGTGLSVISFFLIMALIPNSKIIILGSLIFITHFLYNIPPIRLKTIPFIDVLSAATTYLPPLFIGYVFVSNKWPGFWWIMAAIFYFSATDLYNKVIDIESDKVTKTKSLATILKKQKSLVVCFFLMIMSGLILALVGKLIYSLVILPYLIIFAVSLFARNYELLLKIYSKTFIINNCWGALVTSYFLVPILWIT